MNPRLFLAVLPLALAGCTIIPPAPEPVASTTQAPSPTPANEADTNTASDQQPIWIAFGESATIGRIQVRPISIAEDSRCALGTQCVWAGRVVVQTQVTYAGTRTEAPFALGEPVAIAEGALTLVEVRPAKTTEAIAPADYQFGYSFNDRP